MVDFLALKIIGAVAGVAAISAAAFWVIPVPASPNGVWLDSPVDGSVIEEGPISITLHSEIAGLTGMQAVMTLDGVSVATLTDTLLERTARGANAKPLYWFAQDWNATPGEYEVVLKTCVHDGPCWVTQRTTSLTVVGQAGVIVDFAEGVTNPTPTPPPTARPTPTPTPTPTVSAIASPPPLAPEPSATPPPVSETPYGFIRQTFNDATKLSSAFAIRGARPQQAVGSVQVQVVPVGQTANESAWSSIPCTTALTPDPEFVNAYTCSTANYELPPGNGTARTGYYRVVLVNGDKVYTGPLQYWSITR